MQQTGNVPDESLLEFAGFAISQRHPVHCLYQAGAFGFIQFLGVTRQCMCVDGIIGELFCALQHLGRFIRLDLKTVSDELQDHVFFEIGIDAINCGGLDEQRNRSVIFFNIPDRRRRQVG